MAATIEEFKSALEGEVTVDLEKIKEFAISGVPKDVREEVWLLLLGVVPTKKSLVVQKQRDLEQEYAKLSKSSSEFGRRISSDVQEIIPKVQSMGDPPAELIRRVKRVIAAYINVQLIDYDSWMTQLICPLSHVIQSEAHLFDAFRRVLSLKDELDTIQSRSSQCLAMFRAYLPDLYQHFEDEEVNFTSCVEPWLKSMMAVHVPLPDVLILWDTYLSQGFWFHPYVCMACLNSIKDELEELYQQDIKLHLKFLDNVNIEEVLVEARGYYVNSRSAFG